MCGMASWTPARSILLSQLLDDVVGTEEMVHIRQDYCRIHDCIKSTTDSNNDSVYYTGSKAEGLDLPGSDDDHMMDINNTTKLMIIQQMKDAPTTIHERSMFLILTENGPPCFVMLRSVNQIQNNYLFDACQILDNAMHLSSYLLVHNAESRMNEIPFNEKKARQGPSLERWSPYMDTSQSGTDNVPSIRCLFWPYSATEWRTRPRRSAWPSPSAMKSIVDFGFHLVPVGHPLSDRHMMESRISFSVAERTLVWSFNHVQMQCYAVMKIILKDFINPHCSPDSRVLCSYFIKTSLFWKYEETDPSFWCQENLRECIMFLLCGFRECLFHGSLKHYFIPVFNLIFVMLTSEARAETIRTIDTCIMLQSDISIIRECNTQKPVWDAFMNYAHAGIGDCGLRRRGNQLKTDATLMNNVFRLQTTILKESQSHLISVLELFVSRCFQAFQKSSLISFAIQLIVFQLSKMSIDDSTPLNTATQRSIRLADIYI